MGGKGRVKCECSPSRFRLFSLYRDCMHIYLVLSFRLTRYFCNFKCLLCLHLISLSRVLPLSLPPSLPQLSIALQASWGSRWNSLKATWPLPLTRPPSLLLARDRRGR